MSAKQKVVSGRLPQISPNAKPEDVVTIHFLEDGLTAFGNVWYRGQELSIEKGSPEWESTLDENGESWLERDEDTQLDIWGIRFHRPGHWKGKGFDIDDPVLTEEDKARLMALEKAKSGAASGRKVPAAKRGPGRPPKLG